MDNIDLSMLQLGDAQDMQLALRSYKATMQQNCQKIELDSGGITETLSRFDCDFKVGSVSCLYKRFLGNHCVYFSLKTFVGKPCFI